MVRFVIVAAIGEDAWKLVKGKNGDGWIDAETGGKRVVKLVFVAEFASDLDSRPRARISKR